MIIDAAGSQPPPPDHGAESFQNPKPNTPVSEVMTKYGGVFKEIATTCEASPLFDQVCLVEEKEGLVDGIKYRVYNGYVGRDHQPEHANIAMVDIVNPDGTQFACVLRHEPTMSDVNDYKAAVARNPAVATLVPKLFGTFGGWAVLERVYGLEYRDLNNKLKTDRDFRIRFARNAADYLKNISDLGIELNDVSLSEGANCRVDQQTAQIKLIEQDSTNPYKPHQANELLTGMLIEELEYLSGITGRNYGAEIAYHMLRRVFELTPPEQLFVQTRAVTPGNPMFRNAYFQLYIKEISPGDYARLLGDTANWNRYAIPMFGKGGAEIIAPELVNAAAGDFDGFKKVFKSAKRVSTHITDTLDPRSKSIILPNDYIYELLPKG